MGRLAGARILLLALALAAFPAEAVNRYVDQVGSNTSNVCDNPSFPCRTITYAMSLALAGDTIIVSPGQYDIAVETFPITVKNGVRLVAADLDHGAVIDAFANTRVFVVPASNSSTEISGFTIRGGRASSSNSTAEGGAILAAGSLKITRNLFTQNEAHGFTGAPGSNGGTAVGGAISITSGDPTIANNLFAGNFAYGGAGGDNPSGVGGPGGVAGSAAVYNGGLGTFINNTFFNNYAYGGNGGSGITVGSGGGAVGGAASTGSATILVNNLYAQNGAQSGEGSTPGQTFYGAVFVGAAGVLNSNNLYFLNFPGDTNEPGAAAVFADPQFHFSSQRIAPYSPARGAGYAPGAPATDFEGVTRPSPPSIGAFEASGELLTTDLNADGRSDVLWRNVANGQIYRLLMNGFAITSGAVAYTEPNLAWKVVADADFNGDGVGDLVWRNTSTGAVYIMFLNGNGVAAGGGVAYVEPNQAWKIVATPDVDGDEQADLLWWNSSTGQVWVMLMNGTAIKAQGGVYTEPNTSWRIVAHGNFAGGKQNQVLWRNSVTGQVYLMYIDTQFGTFFPELKPVYQEANTAWKIVAGADFNGDGWHDILWRNDSTGQVYMMLMAYPFIGAQAMIHHEPNLAWKIVAVGDYNGDGKADILWRNDATGQVYMMRMNGLTIAQQGPIYTEPNLSWKVLGPAEYAQ